MIKQSHLQRLKEEYGLQMKLFDAKLAKAQLEKTEVSANANEQRLELQKMLLESDAKVWNTNTT